MLSEEKQAVENLEKLVKLRKNIRGEITHDTCICGTSDLDTVLNLITKLQKENKDLLKERKKYTILLTDKEYRKVIENAQKDIAEQKDKRIQELEEYIAIAPNLDEMTATKYIVIQEEAYIRGKAEEQQKAEQTIRENYIPKQAVIDKIKELDIAILECEYDDDDVEEYKNDVEKEKRILLIKKSALEELLEEK